MADACQLSFDTFETMYATKKLTTDVMIIY